jgi:DNA-binding CsgD family transcriptional regulator
VFDMPKPEHTALHEWFGQMLDEIDYGMLLLNDRLDVLHANHVAQGEMDAKHPLHLQGRELRARRPLDMGVMHDALQGAARRGLRRLFSVGEGAQAVSVAVVPLQGGAGAARGAAMLVVLGKRQMCGELSVQWFARNHSLTHAETRVLAALCAGRDPSQIAISQGVTLHTVRTQIGSVRAKTGAISIRELIRQVSMLPPLVSAIRGGAWLGDDAQDQPAPLRRHPAARQAAFDGLPA